MSHGTRRISVVGAAVMALIALLVVLFVSEGEALAASGEERFVDFDSFLESVKSAKFESFAAREGVRVASAAEFERMRAHILSLYEGIDAANSFLLAGAYVDCIDRNKQPSLRRNGGFLPIKTPPAMKVAESKTADPDRLDKDVGAMLSADRKDAFGNAEYCRQGFIPMRRVTLERLVRYDTLAHFLHKYGMAATDLHRWASSGQNVNNRGGDSYLNVWKPIAEPGVFALSQQWYIGGSGSKRQTVEGGWQVSRDFYRTYEPSLFIYFTPDNYGPGGCYNLDCRGFVQTSQEWVIGGPVSPVSTDGGAQYAFRMVWLFSGEWYLFLQREGSVDLKIVGYYPVALFKGGQMSKHAERVDFGGETATYSDLTGQMGSGAFAKAGYSHAAYQRLIFYYDKSSKLQRAKLSSTQRTKSCYTIDVHNKTGGTFWDTYFLFGGPRCPN